MSRHPQGLRPHLTRVLPPSRYLAPYVQTPRDVVERMLALAGVGSEDIVADLGAGDGRIVLAAASTHRARAVGYEIDPDLVAEARGAIDRAGLRHLAEIRDQDLLSANLSQATVFTLYLTTGANVRLRPRILEHARRGARIVSHEFGMGMWSPKQVERMRDTSGVPRTLYLWQI